MLTHKPDVQHRPGLLSLNPPPIMKVQNGLQITQQLCIVPGITARGYHFQLDACLGLLLLLEAVYAPLVTASDSH